MAAKSEGKSKAGSAKVKVLGPTYEAGTPQGEELGRWRQKLEARADKIKYLQTGERYWYSEEWFGSEKRKTPA